jgi:hypothetical protein
LDQIPAAHVPSSTLFLLQIGKGEKRITDEILDFPFHNPQSAIRIRLASGTLDGP